MRRKVLLITGANGFLAHAVVRQLHVDWQLVALVRTGTSSKSDFQITHESVESLVSEFSHIDIVMHLAACIPTPLDAESAELIPVNVDLVAKLANVYPDARHVLASSVSVFGVPQSLPLTLDTHPNHPSAYGKSKLAAEKIVRQMSNHAVIRFSSLIGVGMKSGSFIPAIISAAQEGEIRLFGSGDRLQNYLDIEDAALMCARAAECNRSFIALGVGERSYSNKEVASILGSLTGASIVHEGYDCSPSFVYDFQEAMDIGKRYISLRESLEKMVHKT